MIGIRNPIKTQKVIKTYNFIFFKPGKEREYYNEIWYSTDLYATAIKNIQKIVYWFIKRELYWIIIGLLLNLKKKSF